MRAIELAGVTCARKRGGVHDIDLTAQAGERIALFGPPGSGKSTILELLAGLIGADSGRVQVLGRPPRPRSKLRGYAAEDANWRAPHTPRRILSRSLSDARVPGSQRPGRMAETLETCGLYEIRDLPNREVSHLQRRCLMIAQAIVHR